MATERSCVCVCVCVRITVTSSVTNPILNALGCNPNPCGGRPAIVIDSHTTTIIVVTRAHNTQLHVSPVCF
jgi:hypothetical protein